MTLLILTRWLSSSGWWSLPSRWTASIHSQLTRLQVQRQFQNLRAGILDEPKIIDRNMCWDFRLNEKAGQCSSIVKSTESETLPKGRSHVKETVKKGDIVRTGRGGVNPSSFFKAKFTGFSNHSEMDF